MMSGCSLGKQNNNFNLTEQEVTSILNDGCTIKRDIRQRYRIDGKRYRTLSSSRGYKKRGIASWYGTDFDGEKRLRVVKSMICMTSQLLIKRFRYPPI